MIASRFAPQFIHALLYYAPAAARCDDEAMQVQSESVLNSGAVHFGDQPARPRQRMTIEAGSLGHLEEFGRCLPRVSTPTSAHVEAEFMLKRRQSTLQRSKDA